MGWVRVCDSDGEVLSEEWVAEPDPPAADPDVTELAAALANLPTDTLAALRDVLRSLNATA